MPRRKAEETTVVENSETLPVTMTTEEISEIEWIDNGPLDPATMEEIIGATAQEETEAAGPRLAIYHDRERALTEAVEYAYIEATVCQAAPDSAAITKRAALYTEFLSNGRMDAKLKALKLAGRDAVAVAHKRRISTTAEDVIARASAYYDFLVG